MFFFFKQKTAYEMRISDWSSDVCSSDLRLARAGRADQQDVGLGQLDVVVLLPALDPLVEVVDGHRQRTLGAGLADHVLVADFQDLLRLVQRAARRLGLLLELLADDVVADRKCTRLYSSHYCESRSPSSS